MSTNSKIGILNKDNTVTSIYCHWDGYLDHVGSVLTTYYNTEEKVRELISLGCLSSLYPKVKPDPGVPHSFNEPAGNTTVAYHRDRNDPWDRVKPKRHGDEDEFWSSTEFPYIYLFRPKMNTWEYRGRQDSESTVINPETTENDLLTISVNDLLAAYKEYEASEDVKTHLLYFISEVTGKSVDTLLINQREDIS